MKAPYPQSPRIEFRRQEGTICHKARNYFICINYLHMLRDMNCTLLPPPSQPSRSIAEIAREADLTWVTTRNTLQGEGTIASLDWVRHVLGCRWSWTAGIDPSRVGRELAARRKAKGMSQRATAARLRSKMARGGQRDAYG